MRRCAHIMVLLAALLFPVSTLYAQESAPQEITLAAGDAAASSATALGQSATSRPPMAITTMFVSPHTRLAPQVTSGVDVTLFGDIAKDSAAGVRIHAEGENYYVLVGVLDYQLTLGRQEYTITEHTSDSDTSTKHTANILAFKWAPDRSALGLPKRVGIVLGSTMYYDDNGDSGTDFSQPYAGISYRYKHRLTANAGINWLSGDIDEDTGAYGSLSYEVGDELILFADYNSKDFHKLVFNQVILPAAGVDCSTCDNAALSLGMSFRLGGMGLANVGVYDVNDLAAPTGSLSMNFDF